MLPAPVNLTDQPDEALPGLLADAARDARQLLALSAQVYDLDPLEDAERLSTLREQLRGIVQAMRPNADASGPALAVARTLLDQVSARQSPVGTRLYGLMRSDIDRFTPALVRALWQTYGRARTLEQLFGPVTNGNRAEADFLTRELVFLGALTATRGSTDADAPQRYRITPAGRHALRPIARQVLELELGRFPWPEGVPRPQEWANERGVALYEFQHGGSDGAKVALCVGEPPGSIPSLSVPHLLGVAGRESGAHAPTAHAPYSALAVLWGDANRWSVPEVVVRMKDILDDQSKIRQRVDQQAGEWRVTLFAGNDMVDKYGHELRHVCEEADVACAFAD